MKRIALILLIIPCFLFGQAGSSSVFNDVAINGDLTLYGGAIGSFNQTPITETLRVTPDGDGTDGLTWDTAYQTIQSALDAASTDANDCTLIMIAPHATYYNINTTGDPTWTGNYILSGTHRSWASVKNTHETQTSIMKFSGKVQVINLSFSLTAGGNGLIFTGKGFRIDKCGFNGENSTGASTALWIDGTTTIKGGKIRDVTILGNVSYTTGILFDNASVNTIDDVTFHDCLAGLQIVNADSDDNEFTNMDIGYSTIGIDLDAGNGQQFQSINLHNCATNIDDEVGDALWSDIVGQFNMDTLPDDLTGVSVAASADAGVWGADVEVRASATSTKPFKVVGYIFEPAVTQKHKVRFTADNGATYFDETFVEQTKNSGSDASSDTDFIFNVGTQIKASVKAESGGSDVIYIWLKIQEL